MIPEGGDADQRPEAARSDVTGGVAIRTGTSPRVLVASCLGYAMVIVDTNVVNVALPSLSRHLHTSITGLQWVVDSYTLVFAVLLLTGGALGDRYGAKRVFMNGLGLFVLASLECGLADSVPFLVVGRVMQGVGAAAVVPASLSLIRGAYSDHISRARAVGLWGATAGITAALGPVIGGVLVEAVGWRAVFFVNLPVGAVALGIGARMRTRSDRQSHSIDLRGQLIAGGCLTGLALALIEAGAHGWRSPIVTFGLVGFVSGAALLIAVERRSTSPILPAQMFTSTAFSASLAVGMCANFGFFGELFVMTLYLQNVRGLSPLVAGLVLTPQILATIAGSIFAGRVMGRKGPRPPMLAGWIACAAGLLGLLAVSRNSPYWEVFPCLVAAGFGISLAMMAATAFVMETAPAERAGLASAAVNAARQLGGMLGVALLGSLVVSTPRFITGMHVAVTIAGCSFLAALVITFIFVRPLKSNKPRGGVF